MINEIRPRLLFCLTGFMGSGKSTAGRLLGRQIGWPYTDLDKQITDSAGITIPEIFSRMGESEFRRIEHEQLVRVVQKTVEAQKPRVVSLGGGTIAQPQNAASLRENGAVLIWLHCPIEELLLRCAQITDRPLFRDEESFRRLYEERLPTYQASHYRVESDNEPMRVVEQILALGIFPKVTA